MNAENLPAVGAPVEPTVRPEPAAYMVTVPVDVGVGMDRDTVLRWEPGLPDEDSEPLYDIAAVRELAALELERVAAEAPVNGNHLATERVLMAAQRLRGPNVRGNADRTDAPALEGATTDASRAGSR